MPDYLQGRQTTVHINQAEREVDIPRELEWLRPDNAPLVKLTKGGGAKGKLPIKKDVTMNPEFKCLEKEPHGVWTAINNGTGYTAGDTDFILDAVAHLIVGDVLQIIGGEVVQITAITTTTSTVTVTRSIGPTAAGSITDNTPVYTIGHASEENSDIPTINKVKNRDRTNYTQIFREPFGLSRTLAKSALYQGKKRPEMRREAFLEHERDQERAFLFSEPAEDTTGGPNGEVIRYTGGVNYWITSGGGYTMTATTTFTKTDWTTFCQNAFEYGSETKVFVCAPLLISMFDYWKDNKLEMKPSEYTYGIKVATWESGHGTVLIIRDRELRNSPAGDGSGYGGTGFMLDTENIGYRYLTDSDTKLRENIIINGKDGWTDEYLTECGLFLSLPETHSKLAGIATYS